MATNEVDDNNDFNCHERAPEVQGREFTRVTLGTTL